LAKTTDMNKCDGCDVLRKVWSVVLSSLLNISYKTFSLVLHLMNLTCQVQK